MASSLSTMMREFVRSSAEILPSGDNMLFTRGSTSGALR